MGISLVRRSSGWNKRVLEKLERFPEFTVADFGEISENGQFTVNIGLCKQHEVIAGIVVSPVLRQSYIAAKGLGAHFHQYNSNGSIIEERHNIRVRSFAWKQPGLKIIGSRSHCDPLTQKFMDQFVQPQVLFAGSSWKLCMVADGAADVYPRLAPTSEWDSCAAQCVVQEAGGRVLQVTETGKVTDQPVIYNKQCLLNPYFIVVGDVAVDAFY
eukprot:Gregarina_sp_Poly_1__603@NODE_1141_length_4960_cov_269_731453_g787_i0_p3_GENE_NODE_1141_length_4960_cov_269_731453_g787_i0NODE_1141_length_4960_cov_269_731453_g787_i0_p3_ORF_typecomplete_len213_score24_11Inositol_P/PF00459_25/1_9e27_NODE_1141_length_4960_cov_269_731453_g787_i015922230